MSTVGDAIVDFLRSKKDNDLGPRVPEIAAAVGISREQAQEELAKLAKEQIAHNSGLDNWEYGPPPEPPDFDIDQSP